MARYSQLGSTKLNSEAMMPPITVSTSRSPATVGLPGISRLIWMSTWMQAAIAV
ncbi:hypothetical protein D9M69_655850 [compost metagenome]